MSLWMFFLWILHQLKIMEVSWAAIFFIAACPSFLNLLSHSDFEMEWQERRAGAAISPLPFFLVTPSQSPSCYYQTNLSFWDDSKKSLSHWGWGLGLLALLYCHSLLHYQVPTVLFNNVADLTFVWRQGFGARKQSSLKSDFPFALFSFLFTLSSLIINEDEQEPGWGREGFARRF